MARPRGRAWLGPPTPSRRTAVRAWRRCRGRRRLLLAAELTGRPAKDVADAALDRGLVVNAVTPTAIRLAPSLLVTDDEVDEALAVLDGILSC